MKKIFLIIAFLITGGLFSFFSFLYGSVEPEYGPPTGSDITCQSLALRPNDLREITYSRGFPIQKSDTIQFDIVCGYASKYVPSPGEIARSWQLYANWVIYAFLFTSVAFGLNKIKKHNSSPYHKR